MKIFSSMIAAIGKQLKQSVNVFHNLMLYRRLPKPSKKKRKTRRVGNECELTWDERRQIQRTFVVKAIYPVDTGTFVIASEDEEVFGIFDLVCK